LREALASSLILAMASGQGMRGVLENIVNSNSDASVRMEKFSELVKALVTQHDVQQLKDLVDCMLAEESSFALFARPVLQQVAEQMDKLKNVELKELALHTLEKLRGRVVSFEEEDFVMRELLSEVFQAEGDWNEAAKCLACINLEAGTRCRTPLQKAEKYVKIAELYLEDEDPVAANTFCARAAMVMHEVEDLPLNLRFKVCHARIMDSQRKFLEAASKYCDLSQQTMSGQVMEEDLLVLLKCAVTCAILAPAGPQRSRILALLCKDERIRSVEHNEILQKMFLERLIRGTEVQKFEQSLMPHQKATLADGQTVLEKAVLQHNVLAASRVYKNMRLPDLGQLLEVPPDRAEKIAAKMIAERRLDGYIDQQGGMIHFQGSGENLEQWDRHIRNVCNQVNSVLTKIKDHSAMNDV
jgi:COP9 signalosome complex subunit 4